MANYTLRTGYTVGATKLAHAKAWCIAEGARFSDNNFNEETLVARDEDPDAKAKELGDALWDKLVAAGHKITKREDLGKVRD